MVGKYFWDSGLCLTQLLNNVVDPISPQSFLQTYSRARAWVRFRVRVRVRVRVRIGV